MNILGITILVGNGADKVSIQTDLPSGIWPYEGCQSLDTEIAAGNGKTWVLKCFPYFPEESIKIIKIRGIV